MNVLEKLNQIGIVPVIRLEDPDDDALPLAKTLVCANLPCAEITFRAAGAQRAIKIMKEAYPSLLIGAGTILEESQMQAAKDAGGDFVVTPGLDEGLIDYAKRIEIPIIPGISSASDLHRAYRHGLHVVKFFPAEQAGGRAMIKALRAPFSMMSFMPTGGISEQNLGDYLKTPGVICCGASYLAPPEMIAAGDWEGIETICKNAVRAVMEVRKNA